MSSNVNQPARELEGAPGIGRARAASAVALAGTVALLRKRLYLAVAVAVQVIVFLPIAAFRALDGDEGEYAYAAARVVHGGIPYRDFFWEQMPLFPFVYGAWYRIFGTTWDAGRSCSAVLAITAGVVLYTHVRRRFGDRYALIAAVLFALSGSVFAWFTTIETYALSSLLLLGAFTLLEYERDVSSARAAVASGFLAALAVDTRLLLALPVLVLVVASTRRTRWLAGFALGLVPSLVFLALTPGRFFFDNVGYHRVKTSIGFGEGLSVRATVVTHLLDGGAGNQFFLLVFACILAAVALRRLRRPLPLALMVAAAVIVASLTPTPAYASYFCVAVPFMLLGVLEFVAAADATTAGAPSPVRVIGGTTIAVAIALYAALSLVELRGLVHDARSSTLTMGAAAQVTSAVDANAPAGALALSSWPGYVFDSHVKLVPRTENPFVPAAATRLTPSEVRRYALITPAETERIIRSRRAAVVVFGRDRQWLFAGERDDVRWQRAVSAAGYRLVAALPMASVYVRGR